MLWCSVSGVSAHKCIANIRDGQVIALGLGLSDRGEHHAITGDYALVVGDGADVGLGNTEAEGLLDIRYLAECGFEGTAGNRYAYISL